MKKNLRKSTLPVAHITDPAVIAKAKAEAELSELRNRMKAIAYGPPVEVKVYGIQPIHPRDDRSTIMGAIQHKIHKLGVCDAVIQQVISVNNGSDGTYGQYRVSRFGGDVLQDRGYIIKADGVYVSI
jgi:hypothetical protein